MNVVTILAVRYASSRLPGKMLLPINGKTMTELIINRLLRSKKSDALVVATSPSTVPYLKDIIRDYNENVSLFVGSEDDVLTRYYDAAKRANADVVVRATGDNPLVSLDALDALVSYHVSRKADVSHYRDLPWGAGVEVLSFEALSRAYTHAKDPFYREHITQYIYANEGDFVIKRPRAPKKWRAKKMRITVDTREDYAKMRMLFSAFSHAGDFLEIDEVIRNFDKNTGALSDNVGRILKKQKKTVDNNFFLC